MFKPTPAAQCSFGRSSTGRKNKRSFDPLCPSRKLSEAQDLPVAAERTARPKVCWGTSPQTLSVAAVVGIVDDEDRSRMRMSRSHEHVHDLAGDVIWC